MDNDVKTAGSENMMTRDVCVEGGVQRVALTDNARRVLSSRYLIKEDGQVVESPEQMFDRVARAVAEVELDTYDADPVDVSGWRTKFYELMASRKFMPNSPTLMNAGRPLSMLSACFVLPIPDNLEGIMRGVVDTSFVQRSGGGTGFTLDELRPSGAYIRSSGGTTSGPISFWRMYCEATCAIQQGAFRRGANMQMMSVTHPDIIKFLCVKANLAEFTNYNVSAKLTDVWMKRLSDRPESPHEVFDHHSNQGYVMPRELIQRTRDAVQAGIENQCNIRLVDNCYTIHDMCKLDPDGGIPSGQWVTHGDLWKLIVDNAHRTGEPGVAFIDRVRETEPTPHIGKINASNPCGEQWLLPNEACNLGSVNLAEFVPESDDFVSVTDFDWDGLSDTVHTAVRFLDNVVDANRYPTEEISSLTRNNRKIGLGIMGLADTLYRLRTPYDSVEGVAAAKEFMSFVDSAALEASKGLADERGVFPNWKGSLRERQELCVRNAEWTTIAPTGTISIIAGCSCGMEPLFSLSFKRNVLDGEQLTEHCNPFFEHIARTHGFWRDTLLGEIVKHGSIRHLDYIPDEFKAVFACAHDVSPEWHIRMQSALQEHVSNSISKTINLPRSATVEDVDKVFRMAWKMKCKAVTSV